MGNGEERDSEGEAGEIAMLKRQLVSDKKYETFRMEDCVMG